MKSPDTMNKKSSKRKYWYRCYISTCVLCGVEYKERYRVYNEHEKGTYFKDFACPQHFM